ncbi:hypothetical protein [Psychrobacter sp. AT9]|uniref:hypothetical protein n=1 Tax=Psychrobacter sp. AT9 TaxID=3242893 RepID=UPI0039A7051A
MYVCQTLVDNVCYEWVEQTSLLDTLAITKESAAGLTIAICTLLVIAYIGGLIGKTMMQA